MKNLLKLEDITMQFGGVVAVNNLSLEVNEGEIVTLIGANGAGKTTLIKQKHGARLKKLAPCFLPSEKTFFGET